MQAGIGLGVVAKVAPVSRHAEHHAEAHALQVVYKILRVGDGVPAPVVEADTPQRHQRPPVMVQVRRVVVTAEQVELVGNAPDVDQDCVAPGRTHAAKVVHHADGTPVLVGRRHGVGQHLVEMTPAALSADFRHEALHEHPVHAILAHPAEVGVHRAVVIRREGVCRTAVGKPELRLVQFLVLPRFGPEVDTGRPRAETVAPLVVVPAAAGTVVGSVEPPLVSGHDKPLVRIIRLTHGGAALRLPRVGVEGDERHRHKKHGEKHLICLSHVAQR